MSAAKHTVAGVSPDDLAFRLGVTLIALMVYRLGCQLPVPGLDPQLVAQLAESHTPETNKVIERCSIFALGVTPLFAALALAELFKMLVPSARRWEQAKARNSYEFNKMVLVLALALAVWQARDIALGLERSHSAAGFVVPQPGLMFRIPYILIIVAATAFLSWLADEVTRRGIGNGIWLLFISPWLAEAPAWLVRHIKAQGQGELSMLQLSAAIVFVVLAIALLSGATEADRNRRSLAIRIWPFALAYGALYVLRYSFQNTGLVWFGPEHPAYLLALGLLIAFFALLEARSFRLAEAASPNPAMREMPALPTAIVAAVPIVTAVAADFLMYQLHVPLLYGGRAVTVITVVMLSILGVLGLSARAFSYPK